MMAEQRRLVLVLSPERSGSTLLATMLGAHSAIVAPPELFLLRYPTFDTWRREKRAALASVTWLMRHLGEPADEPAIRARFQGLATTDVYRWILARMGAGGILVDKTPAHARDRATLERAETLAPHYLWLTRHPLGVANSWIERRRSRRWRRLGHLGTAAAQRLAGARAGFGRWLCDRLDDDALDDALARWRLANETVAEFLERVPAERRFHVTYEDLVRSPEPTLGGIAAWLGTELEAAMLEPWKHLPDALTAGVGDERIRAHKTIQAARADSWRDRLDEARLDAHTRSIMERLPCYARS